MAAIPWIRRTSTVDQVVERVRTLVEGGDRSMDGGGGAGDTVVGEQVNARRSRVELGARATTSSSAPTCSTGSAPRLVDARLRGRCGLVTSERVGALYREPASSGRSRGGLSRRSWSRSRRRGAEERSPWLGTIRTRLLEAPASSAAAAGGRPRRRRASATSPASRRRRCCAGFRRCRCRRRCSHRSTRRSAARPRSTTVGKNLIGAFHQPRLVLADVGALATLPRRELAAGLAEVIKYGVIGDAALFARSRRPDASSGRSATAVVPDRRRVLRARRRQSSRRTSARSAVSVPC